MRETKNRALCPIDGIGLSLSNSKALTLSLSRVSYEWYQEGGPPTSGLVVKILLLNLFDINRGSSIDSKFISFIDMKRNGND